MQLNSNRQSNINVNQDSSPSSSSFIKKHQIFFTAIGTLGALIVLAGAGAGVEVYLSSQSINQFFY